MGQVLPELRLVFADEHDNACGALPAGLTAALELRLESPAANSSPGGAPLCLPLGATQVRARKQGKPREALSLIRARR